MQSHDQNFQAKQHLQAAMQELSQAEAALRTASVTSAVGTVSSARRRGLFGYAQMFQYSGSDAVLLINVPVTSSHCDNTYSFGRKSARSVVANMSENANMNRASAQVQSAAHRILQVYSRMIICHRFHSSVIVYGKHGRYTRRTSKQSAT
jgi:hypothetical protein